MKINKKTILKALEIVKPGLANKEMIEQTTSFCFIKGSVVTYNDEVSVSCPVKGIDLEGAVNAIELHSFISKVRTEEFDLEVKENEILLKAGRSKAGLTLQSEVLLPIEEIGKIKKWKPIPEDFLEALKFTMGSCSNNMSDPKLTCVHVNKTILEAADNFRLAYYELKDKLTIKPFLLPASSCSKVIKMNPLEIAEGEGWIHFKTKEKAILSCRLFEENYVNTSPLLNVEGKAILFPKTIIDILERAEIFSKRDFILEEQVNIRLENKKLLIKSQSDSGWFEEKAKVNYSGDAVEFIISPYLLKAILNKTTKAILGSGRLMFEEKNWKYITMLKE